MPLLFAATLFLSASLLFMVQPMVAKMVLPLLGGSPAVWNACMVFFQLLLLFGYQYAHFVTLKCSPRKQLLIHVLMLGLPLAAFGLAIAFGARHSPIAIVESLAPSDDSSPVISVLMLMTVAIGIPFLVVSTSAPLLQKWFGYTGHPSSRDPYFLYSASNAGSLISLLGYPIFIEPNLSIVNQAWVFALGFAVLAILIVICGRAAANPVGVPPESPQAAATKAAQKAAKSGGSQGIPNANQPAPPMAPIAVEPAPTLLRKLKWIALAFVPSSLMLGVTFHMTTDIASIPLLWVGPLALYLITFIIAFGRVPDWFRIVIGNLAPVMILLLVFVLISDVNPGFGIKILLHNLTFFAAALMCHYELARDRPSPAHLTGFFLLMSVGGVLGGIFNSLIAPLVFPRDYEYSIALIVACLLVPKLIEEKDTSPRTVRQNRISLGLDILLPILMGVGFYYLRKLTGVEWYVDMVTSVAKSIGLALETINVIFIFAIPVMVCFFFVDRPVRFALCVAAILGYSKYQEESRGVIHSERSFFGILKIETDEDEQRPAFLNEDKTKRIVSGRILYHRLVHGTTLHGTQIRRLDNNVFDMFQAIGSANPWDSITVTVANHAFNASEEPLTYYHRSGPVGAMVSEMRSRKGGKEAKADFAMVGLGTGSASCYVQPGQRLTFYEIDPAVKRLVADTDKYFTYVTDGRNRARREPGGDLDFRMGDARLKLKEDTDRKYTLLLVDAFSSDSIPVHLLTVEALQLYLERMTPDGILALHISNRWVQLEPAVAAIANKLGLTARVWSDNADRWPGKTASSWVVLARNPEDLGKLYSEYGDLIFPVVTEGKRDDKNFHERIHQGLGMESQLYEGLVADFVELKVVTDKKWKHQELNESPDAPAAWLSWVIEKKAKETDPALKLRLAIYEDLIKRFGPNATYQNIMVKDLGHAFRKLETYKTVAAWTDDYSDVMGVMTIPEVQRVRRFFGLPTLGGR